jgi:hypothetical protein
VIGSVSGTFVQSQTNEAPKYQTISGNFNNWNWFIGERFNGRFYVENIQNGSRIFSIISQIV